jgi:hypothetical protein
MFTPQGRIRRGESRLVPRQALADKEELELKATTMAQFWKTPLQTGGHNASAHHEPMRSGQEDRLPQGRHS